MVSILEVDWNHAFEKIQVAFISALVTKPVQIDKFLSPGQIRICSATPIVSKLIWVPLQLLVNLFEGRLYMFFGSDLTTPEVQKQQSSA